MNASRRAFLAGAIGAAVVVSGCAGGAVSGAYNKGGDYSVALGRPWSDISSMLPNRPPNVRMLSIDGPLLNRLYLAGLRPGQSLLKPSDRDTPIPTYRADMNDSEMVEFVIDCVALEYQSPEATSLRPQNFGAAPGVRFDITTRTSSGLNMSGSALVARAGDRLNLVLFLAPSEHYYGALLADVEAIMASATLAS